MWQDVKFAVRILRRSPGFALAAILTFALGIGANTAIFSIVDGAVLRPLPYDQPNRVVSIALHNPSTGRRTTGAMPRDAGRPALRIGSDDPVRPCERGRGVRACAGDGRQSGGRRSCAPSPRSRPSC
jgi:hypothetical protein